MARYSGAALLLALVALCWTASLVRGATVDPESSLASIIKATSRDNPHFNHLFEKSRAPYFLKNLLRKHAYTYTLFFPTDKALSQYNPQGSCKQAPFSDVLAQLMVPTLYTKDGLLSLKRGKKLRTMSPEYITILQTKPTIKIAIVNGYQKIVSQATVVKTDVLVNKRNFVLHYIDNVLTNC